MTTGIHHITAITRSVQANVDFYVGFLGLRLVKRTAGYEDADQLHLFFGDADARPGSLVTFLVWQDGSPGRVGHGQPSEISLALEPTSIGFWLTRALSFGYSLVGPVQEFGEPVLRLKDPDGIIVKLVGTTVFASDAPWKNDDIPAEHAVRRIRGATILTETPDMTEGFLVGHFGYLPDAQDGAILRMVSGSGDVIDIRDAGGFWPGIPGTGTIDHIAFRARDAGEVSTAHAQLQTPNATITNVYDRKYFRSLYVREPGGALFELATDEPGMTVDEPLERLGTALFVPPGASERFDEIRVVLPQFSLPGEERVIYRDLPFVHRFHVPENPDGRTLVLLHGTGGNETDLMPFAAKAAPRSSLLGVRGRSTEERIPRWFRRLALRTFDQADIRAEAEAFAAFVVGCYTSYALLPERTIFIGYSNGANFLAAFMQLHPHLVRYAVLLRAIPVLEHPPAADLSHAKVLVVAGAADPFGKHAPALKERLVGGGATVEEQMIDAGHDLRPADVEAVYTWLAQSTSA